MFKHSAKFTANIALASKTEKKKFFSKASIENLRGLEIPDSVNLKDNKDLICAAYNGFVANQCNANDDMMDVPTAIGIKDLFLHKPLDVEHDQSYIIGHNVAVGWSDYETSALISDEAALSVDGPVNFCLASVIYAAINPYIAEAVINSDDKENEMCYQSISASWEVSFEEYHIVLGSRDLKDAQIISDAEGILKYSKFLRCYGGSGKDENGLFVGRKIVGTKENLIPIGFALTCNPAAKVKGVTLIPPVNEEVVEEETKENDDEKVVEVEVNVEVHASQNTEIEKTTVIHKDMKIEKLEDVIAAFADKETSLAAKSVIDLHLEKSLKEAAAEWDTAKAEKEEAIAKAEQAKVEASDKLALAEKQVKELTDRLAAIETNLAAQEAEANFAARIEYVTKEYDLSTEQLAIATEEIKSFASDEDYSKWLTKFEVMSADKKKGRQTSVASVTTEDALEAAKIAAAALAAAPVNAHSETLSKLEAIAKNVTISTPFSKK